MRASPAGDGSSALDVALTDGAALAWLYRHGEVLARHDEGEVAHIEVGLAAEDLDRFEHRQGAAPPPA